jgi:acetolactate synthase I/III small subunit
MKQLFTISIFTENSIGLLNRVTSMFTRRHLNIESLNTSESETPGIHRYTIVINTTESEVKKLTLQIEKQVEVIRACYHEDADTVFQEIALYKVSTKGVSQGNLVEKLIRDNNARILSFQEDYMFIEKTGHKDETQELLEFLRPYGVLEFVRSGRVSVIKPTESITE